MQTAAASTDKPAWSAIGGFVNFPAAAPARAEGLPTALVELPAACDAGVDHGLLMHVLDEIDYGLMLVNAAAQVHFANHAARRECSPDGALRVCLGQVRPRLDRECDPFLASLAACAAGRRSMLTLHGGALALPVALVPVKEHASRGDEAHTLLVLGKRQLCEPLSVEFFARSHCLTCAETSVLKGLCSGQRPAQIASQSHVALSTVRTQIGSIRQKTEASSIAELIRRVTALPPIVTALNRVNLWPVAATQ